MTLNILYSDADDKWSAWQPYLLRECANSGLDVHLHRTRDNPESVDYVVYSPASPLQDFSPYKNLKGVLSVWAGVDTIAANQTISVPITRMSDDGLKEGMVEYVVGHVMRHHLGLDRHIVNPNNDWHQVCPPLARERTIGILGLGALGLSCGEALTALNFDVLGWSRQTKPHDTIRTHAGPDGLNEVLSQSDILVLLLPDTPQTRDIIRAETLAKAKTGVVIINAGRGPLIKDDDLMAAIQSGKVAHATLDVFRNEPLPKDHPFWANPAVTVTPHIAAETRPATAAKLIAENIRRCEAGEPLLYVVDRTAGY